jgi:TPR repeat protein
MGIGCRRDPLEANMWYVRAADQGSETAKQRLQIIRDAVAGNPGNASNKADLAKKEKKKFMRIF